VGVEEEHNMYLQLLELTLEIWDVSNLVMIIGFQEKRNRYEE